MIIAVARVRMMKMAFHKVICVIAVRNRLVSTIGPVFVTFLVGFAIVIRGTRRWILHAHANLMLVNMPLVFMVEVSIVKVVLMAIVLYGRVAAVRTVVVSMRFVNPMLGAHPIAP